MNTRSVSSLQLAQSRTLSLKTRRILCITISMIMAALFLYAAINKLIIYQIFGYQLKGSPFISQFAGILQWLVPVSEIAIAGLLFINKTRLAGLYLSFFLMLLFSLFIYMLLHFASHVPCGCGGIINKLTWNQHLWFNLAFTALAGFGVGIYPAKLQSTKD